MGSSTNLLTRFDQLRRRSKTVNTPPTVAAKPENTGWGRDVGQFHHFAGGVSACGKYRLAGVSSTLFPVLAPQLVQLRRGDYLFGSNCCAACAAKLEGGRR
jgi:hypothetical protein